MPLSALPASAPASHGAVLRAVLGGALIGLFVAVDGLLAALLLLMLSGGGSGGGSAGGNGDLALAGIGHAGWSAARGMEAGLEAGGVAILLACIALGALAGRAVSSRGVVVRRVSAARA
ncbi:hypothetical protein [Frondihabitans peucedani]|uniref:Uncharacterized protein n=1 Tax=Frondihabitans peucedani TaxID=598626 RepID=A0ABP8E4W6_9MICO